jgi:hypothetical protein
MGAALGRAAGEGCEVGKSLDIGKRWLDRSVARVGHFEERRRPRVGGPRAAHNLSRRELRFR